LIEDRNIRNNAISQPMYERIIQILELLCFTEKGKFYSAEIDLANFGKMAARQSFSFKPFSYKLY
jgi:hypothetical protein